MTATLPLAISHADGWRNTETALRLVLEQRGKEPRVVIVLAGQEVLVGRDSAAGLCVHDASISRRHLALSFNGACASLLDLGSTNGTWLNDERAVGIRPLATGDVIRFGAARLHVVQLPLRGAETSRHADDLEPLPEGLGAVVCDPATVAVYRLALRLARSDISLLLQGETGSGKEVLASVVHRHSRRADGPFVAINCATLTESLAESLLFGHERGAFTGAVTRQVGAFEAAQGGTLFLDEVGELSASNQARLLRVLEEGTVTRVGAVRPVRVDVRVLSATNADLPRDVGWRRFRSDLYFRLNGATVILPPLRARPQDVVPIAERALAEAGGHALGPGVAALLERYAWPGNVRELRNAIEHALALGDGEVVRVEDLPAAVRASTGLAPAAAAPAREGPLQAHVDEAERRVIVGALDAHGWNQTQAARVLGITRRALIYRMERLGLKPRPAGVGRE